MRKPLISLCLMGLFPLFFPSNASATAPGAYETARSLGMGGAAVSIADDYQALYRNPAGLAMQKKTAYSVITPTFSSNSDYSTVVDSIDSLSNSDTAATRSINYKNLQSAMGKTGYRGWSDTIYYTNESGFGISFKYQDSQTYSIENPTSPRVNSSVYKEATFTGSFARSFSKENKQNIFGDKATGWYGASIKVGSRKMTESTYWARDFAALTPNLVKDTDKSGVALDLDFGFMWQLANPLKPTLGLFVGNALESKYSDEAGKNRRHYSIGASIKPLTGEEERSNRLVLACEYYDDGVPCKAFNKLRLGAQVKVAKGLHLLGGIKGGYFTAGFTYSWRDISLGAATYAEELGRRPGDREDRRYIVDGSFRF